ncbi:MAG: WXG100 family type VII secretion target [Oscillospiraceae bacterium]|nr:WXG100 family type VII secretion target [Oscillospiraceae bacterium]
MSLLGNNILTIDIDLLRSSGMSLQESSIRLYELSNALQASFAQLQIDWRSEAGDEFFRKFDVQLLNNLKDYSQVLEQMSNNLKTAVTMYEEVFTAADAVSNAQL